MGSENKTFTSCRNSALTIVLRKRERAGEWASFLIAGIALTLWLCWPDYTPVSKRSGLRISVTPVAYVDVNNMDSLHGAVPSHLAVRLDLHGNMPSLLPRPAPPAIPQVTHWITPDAPLRLPPTPDITALTTQTLFMPVVPQNPFASTDEPHNGVVEISPSLRDAGFTFISPEKPWSVSFTATVVFSASGLPVSLLFDTSTSDTNSLLSWRRAILLSRTSTNAIGTISVGR